MCLKSANADIFQTKDPSFYQGFRFLVKWVSINNANIFGRPVSSIQWVSIVSGNHANRMIPEVESMQNATIKSAG